MPGAAAGAPGDNGPVPGVSTWHRSCSQVASIVPEGSRECFPGSSHTSDSTSRVSISQQIESYLEKHRSVFTDTYSMKPYKLDKNLEKSAKQPKYVKNGDPLDVMKIMQAYANDNGMYARSHMALKSCGGFRLKNYEVMDGHLHVKGRADISLQKCRFVHHGDSYTKLGPFKTEIVHNSPVFVIFHELLTEEDIDYLISWATPRLSTERDIRLREDMNVRKTDWKTRKVKLLNF